MDYYQVGLHKIEQWDANLSSKKLKLSGDKITCPRTSCIEHAFVNEPNASSFEMCARDIDVMWLGFGEVRGSQNAQFLLNNRGKFMNGTSIENMSHVGFKNEDIVKVEFCKSSQTMAFYVNGKEIRKIRDVVCNKDTVWLPTAILNSGSVTLQSLRLD